MKKNKTSIIIKQIGIYSFVFTLLINMIIILFFNTSNIPLYFLALFSPSLFIFSAYLIRNAISGFKYKTILGIRYSKHITTGKKAQALSILYILLSIIILMILFFLEYYIFYWVFIRS